jgi:hypothetical protein
VFSEEAGGGAVALESSLTGADASTTGEVSASVTSGVSSDSEGSVDSGAPESSFGSPSAAGFLEFPRVKAVRRLIAIRALAAPLNFLEAW